MGNVWTSEYDLAGRKVRQIDPDAGVRTMAYDANDRLVRSTDARGKTLAYSYDSLGRKTGLYAGADSDAPRLASWTYDDPAVRYSAGRLTAATRYVGGEAYTNAVTRYSRRGDPLERKITIPAAEGGLAGTYTFTHTYRQVTRLHESTSYEPHGGLPQEKVQHTYNAFDDPCGMFGAAPVPYVNDILYTPVP